MLLMGLTMTELPRRKFLAGLAGIIAAPAIVRASSIMPVRSFSESYSLQPYVIGIDVGGVDSAVYFLLMRRIVEVRARIEEDFARALFSDAFPPRAPALSRSLPDLSAA